MGPKRFIQAKYSPHICKGTPITGYVTYVNEEGESDEES